MRSCKACMITYNRALPWIPGAPHLMTITEHDLVRLTKLSRIAIAPQEQAHIQADLNHMLALIAQLQAVDTQGIMPMAHPLEAHQTMALRLRPDVADETLSQDARDALMGNAPARHDGLYLVPVVIE